MKSTDECPPELRALVERQARAWEENDFETLAADWREDGELVAPAGVFPYSVLRQTLSEFHQSYRDLKVDIRSVFAAPSGTKLAVEWLWTVTRRSDGARSTTEDAIIADLVEGKILSWREYFDLSGSVEARQPS